MYVLLLHLEQTPFEFIAVVVLEEDGMGHSSIRRISGKPRPANVLESLG